MTAPPPIDCDIFIEAAPATVWQFWVDPARMCEWWGTRAELDPRPGGIYRVWMSEQGPTMAGTYVELEPTRRLVFLFGWAEADMAVPPSSTRVEVTLVPEGAGTRLSLRHEDLTGPMAESHHEGWMVHLRQLATAASGSVAAS